MPHPLPDLSKLPPTAARYLHALGLDRIPEREWSRELPIKTVLEVVGELPANANRLRRTRYQTVIAKLTDAHIFLQYYSGLKNYGDFSSPMAESDESPGMEAKVKVAYHPGGFEGLSSKPLNTVEEPDPARKSDPPTGFQLPVNPVFGMSELTVSAEETQTAIEAIADDPSVPNLHRLHRRLIRLSELLSRLGPEVDGTIVVLNEALRVPFCRPEEQISSRFWPAESATSEGFDSETDADPDAHPGQEQRSLGGLAQLFKDDHADHEETDRL